MDENLKNKLMPLFRKSIKGTQLTQREMNFCEKAYRKYPEEYGKLNWDIKIEEGKNLNPFV